jgi:hypothetical protein
MSEFERDLRQRLQALDLPPAPPALAAAARAATVSGRPRGRRDRRGTWIVLAAATLLVGGGLAVASGALVNRMPPENPSQASPTAPAIAADGTAGPSATPAPGHSFPAEVDGRHVLTVSELQAERASGLLEDGSIALAGYWSYGAGAHSCAPPRTGQPGDLELYCHDGEYGITELNEQVLVIPTNPDAPPVRAEGPMLTPWLPNEDWVYPLVALPPVNGQPFPPVPIVVLGHLDDPRAADCRPEAQELCRDRLVIDRIVDFRPEDVPTPAPPSPFPFASSPPARFPTGRCQLLDGGAAEGYSFVGWLDGAELDLETWGDFAGETLYVAIAAEPVWVRQEQNERGTYVLMGRKACFAHETYGGMEIDALAGTTYKLYPDGSTATPRH